MKQGLHKKVILVFLKNFLIYPKANFDEEKPNRRENY